MTDDEAQAIALRGLAFLASDPDRLGRFLNDSGHAPADLRARATEPELLCGVLDALLADESMLLVFCSETGIPAANIMPARLSLGGTWQTSA